MQNQQALMFKLFQALSFMRFFVLQFSGILRPIKEHVSSQAPSSSSKWMESSGSRQLMLD
jgi:hypothetical protein